MDTPVIDHPAYRNVSEYFDRFVAFRRDLHRHPELGFQEVRTADRIAQALSELNLEPARGLGKTGIVASIKGCRNESGRTIGIRADIDAIPVAEETGLPYASATPGVMHGCGHDGHTTMVLAAASYLSKTRQFDGTVQVIFQPGEEGHAGARAMIDDGLFERFPADQVFALHNWPSLPPGTVALNDGPMMAGIDRFWLTLNGKGGHGGHPHQANDPLVPAAHFLTQADSICARNVDPLKSAIIHTHWIEAGGPDSLSIVAEKVRLAGMIKWYDREVRDRVEERLSSIVAGLRVAFDVEPEWTHHRLYPPTLNTAAEARLVGDVAERLLGAKQVTRDHPPSMGSEDFGFMLEERPGAYFRLGQGGEEGRFLHNPGYDFNDAVIPIGAAMFAAIAETALPLGF